MFSSFNARAMGHTISAARAVEIAAAVGFDGVDLLVRDLVDDGSNPAEIRTRIDDLGLRGGAWPLPVNWRGDASAFRADLKRLPTLARVAESLGLTRTGTWLMPETPPGVGVAEALDIHASRLGQVSRILGDHGSRLGLEVIGVRSFRSGRGSVLFDRLGSQKVDDLLEALAHHAGLLVDSFHLEAAGESASVGLERGVNRVAWVHISDLPSGAGLDRDSIIDADRGLPSKFGVVPNRELLKSMKESNFLGPVTCEPLGNCVELQGLGVEQASQRVFAAVRSVWPG